MVPTNSAVRLRSCCTAGATRTVGGGSGGGGFLHPTPSRSATDAPVRTPRPRPARVMLPPKDGTAERRVTDIPVPCRVGPWPNLFRSSVGRRGRGLRRGRGGRRGRRCARRVDHGRGVVSRGEGDFDSAVLASPVGRGVGGEGPVLREPCRAQHLRIHALGLE